MIDLNLANRYLELNYHALYLAINHHRTHKNEHLTFLDFPFLIGIYKDKTSKRVIMKSTQSGITEYLIVLTMDKAKYQQRNVFYVMPTDKLNSFV
jgi:hypothetical protein